VLGQVLLTTDLQAGQQPDQQAGYPAQEEAAHNVAGVFDHCFVHVVINTL